MHKNKVIGVLCAAILVLSGAWLLWQPTSLTPESASRQQTLRGAFAPGANQALSGEAAQGSSGSAEPAVVNLASIPSGIYAPHNQYDQWLKGNIDLDEQEYRIGVTEVAALKAAAQKLRANAAIQNADQIPGKGAPEPGIAFDSLDINECCGGGANVPPDPEMAAGPDHLIAVVNVALEVYDKSGTSLTGPVTLSSFFAAQPACVAGPYGAFDPNVVYDEEADRFSIAVDGNGTHYCIASSQTGDPLGDWNVYAVPANFSNAFHDYPHTGVGDEWIVAGGNQFGGSLPNGFEGRVWAMEKADLYSGGTLTYHTASTSDLYGTPQPLHLHGWDQGTWPSYGDTHYFVTDLYDGCTMQVWQWEIPNAPAIANQIDLCAATGVTGGFPLDVPQQGGAPLQGNDWRMRMFEYRNGHGWVNDTISCNPGGGAVNCVRWTEVDLDGTPSLVQAGVYSSAGQFRIFPDLAVNACNDMAVGYTKSSSSMFPGIWYTGRENGDAPGTLQAEAELKAGEITYTAFDPAPRRWGDYTGMTIDPDGQTFWYLGEYSKNTGNANGRWGTYIGSFAYESCGGGGGGEPDIAVSPDMLDQTQGPDEITEDTLTIANTGDALLTWAIGEEPNTGMMLRPFQGSTPETASPDKSRTDGPTRDGNSLATNDTAVAPFGQLPREPQGDILITHSVSQAIESGNSVSCNASGLHTDNSYYRVFDLDDDFGIDAAFDVNTVEFGVEEAFGAGGDQPISVILYTLSEGDSFVLSNLTEIGRSDFMLTDQAMTIVSINVDGLVPAGERLVVEVFTPEGQTEGNSFFIGSNTAGQTAPSYLRADACGVTQPTDTAAIGFPDMHIVMNVIGASDSGGDICTMPSDVPWLEVVPDAGTTPSNGTDEVTVIYDSTGLSVGTYDANLCVISDDLDEPLVVVPVTLTVEESSEPDILVEPDSITEMTVPGGAVTAPMTITNIGGGILTWEIAEEPVGSSVTVEPMGDPAASSAGLAPTAATGSQGGPRTSQPLGGGAPVVGLEYFNAAMVSFTTDAPENLNFIAGNTRQFFAGDFVNGDFSTLYELDYDTNQLYALDTTSGAQSLIGSSVPQGGETWSGAAGAPDGTFYAAATTCGGSSSIYTSTWQPARLRVSAPCRMRAV